MNKMKFILPITLMVFFLSGCTRSENSIEHSGEKLLDRSVAWIDTINIGNDEISGRYNLLLMDSCVVFADQMQNSLYFHNLSDGSFVSKRLGYGNGPKELISMMYAHPIKNSDGEILIMDSSMGQYSYYPATDSLMFRGRLDFNWGKGEKNRYDDISNYKPMEMSDFAISFVRQDSTILFPLSIINRNFDNIDGERYLQGHIFARLNVNTMKVGEPFGQFPEMYQSKPLPSYEFFDFTVDNGKNQIIYNFAPDSTIYIADSEGVPVKAIGFEPAGINREYPAGFETDIQKYRQNAMKVGTNTGLYFDEEAQLLFRTSILVFEEGNSVMQVYDTDGNLVLEEAMPKYFKMLGKHNDKYYGSRFMPEENGEDLNYPLYVFTINQPE